MNEKPIIILGAGGHGQVIFQVLKDQNRQVIGFTDEASSKEFDKEIGKAILGKDEVIFNYSPEDIFLVNGVGMIPGNNTREKVFGKFKSRGYFFESVVSNRAIIENNVVVGEGSQIMHGAIIQISSAIGENTIVNTGAIVEHHCSVGPDCHVASGATVCGGVKLESGVFVGAGATVMQGVTLGKGSVVAAGAVCYKDVPAGYLCKNQPSILKPAVWDNSEEETADE